MILVMMMVAFSLPAQNTRIATPFWYPSSYIYGFVKGCKQSVEQFQPDFTKKLWPDDVTEVCGCVVDSLRHSLTWLEVQEDMTLENLYGDRMKMIVTTVLPICVEEIQEGKTPKPQIYEESSILGN